MNHLFRTLCLTFILSVAAFAQTTTTVSDEYNKNEFYGGFSHQRVDSGDRGYNGFEVAYVRNVHRYFGIKADVSAAFRKNEFSLSQVDANNQPYSYRGRASNSLYNFLGGVQIKDNAPKGRFKPFAHALIGVAVNRAKFGALTCTSGACPSFVTNSTGDTFTDTGFAGAFGGGLDIRINDKIDLRAIQIDYNPIYSSSRVDNNVRFGVGLVIK
jgi:hypothetical protein